MPPSHSRISAYALIIAISGHDLVAPEHDARRLRDTLIQFGFPGDCVRILAGAQATRNAIIYNIRSISTNPNIMKNTPIIIYFAGHGMRQMISVPGLGAINAECILPYDTLATRGQVPAIPDITISALLGEIAKAKSDYITLLLDCCHSGSGSRGVDDDNSRGKLPEDLHFDPGTLENEDGEIWSEFLKANDVGKMEQNSRSVSTSHPGSFRYQGIKSHVLIASCRENEESYEFSLGGQQPTGLFTSALLDALDDCRQTDMIWDVTHVGLFTRIKDFISDFQSDHGRDKFPQTPQCEGYHRERHVFATSAFPHQGHAIAPISEIPGHPGHYLLPVGELAGVRPESEFEIYDYRKGEPRFKGRFQVSGTDNRGGSMTTINCRKDLKLGPDAYAVLCTLPSPLPIELAPELHQVWTSEEFQTDLASRLNSRYPIDQFIVPVQPGYAPKLRISRSSTGGTKIEPTDGQSRPIVLRSPRPRRLSDALAKAVMFYYHLERQVISSQGHNPFVLQACELMESAPDDLDYLSVAMPNPSKAPIRFQQNIETQVYGSDSQFGLRIENQARQAYYIYVFYFDPNDLSITSIYLPPTDEPSVLPRGSLTIGYGNSGASPVQFAIDRYLKTDSGFFKIFYSISPSEMGTIEQEGVDPNQLADPRNEMHYHQSAPPFGSVLYPVTVLNPYLSGRH